MSAKLARHAVLPFLASLVVATLVLSAGWTDGQEALAMLVAMTGLVLGSAWLQVEVLGKRSGASVGGADPPALVDRPDGFEVCWTRPIDGVARIGWIAAGAMLGPIPPALFQIAILDALGFCAGTAVVAGIAAALARWAFLTFRSLSVQLRGRVLSLNGEQVVIRDGTQVSLHQSRLGSTLSVMRSPRDRDLVSIRGDFETMQAVAERLWGLSDLDGSETDVPLGLRAMRSPSPGGVERS